MLETRVVEEGRHLVGMIDDELLKLAPRAARRIIGA
jgi:hypothetical protein